MHSHLLSGAWRGGGGLLHLLGPPLQGQHAHSPPPLEAFLTLPWQRVDSKNSGSDVWCGFCDLGVSCRLRKLDPEEEDDPFHSYEVQSEVKLESCPSTGPQRLSFDSATFMESGRSPLPRPRGHSLWGSSSFPPEPVAVFSWESGPGVF